MTATVRTRVAIVGAGPAGLLLSHLLGRLGHRIGRHRSAHARADRERRSAPASSSRAPSRCSTRSASSAASRTVGSRHDGIELRFAGEGHRIDFAEPRRAQRLAVPAARGAQGPHRLAPRRTARICASASPSSGSRMPRRSRPRVIATDADGQPTRDRGGLRRRRRRLAQRRARCGDRIVDGRLLPRVPVRLVRHPVRSAPERTRAHLQQLPERLRAHQPAQPDRAAHVLPVRSRGRPERADRGGALGARCRPACPAPP